MSFLDKLKFWKKPAEPARVDVVVPVVEALPEVPTVSMTQEEIQAEIGRLVVLIPQCATDNLKAKYQRKLEALIAAAKG